MRTGLKSGYNVDKLNIRAALLELGRCGYSEPNTKMVIEHALMRWSRGEECAAQRGAIDKKFYGIDLTSWTRVLAAAMARNRHLAKEEKNG